MTCYTQRQCSRTGKVEVSFVALLQVAIVFATAFLVTFCTVPLSRKIAVVLGAIDQPGYRRVNKGPVPRCGGIALYLGLCAAFLVAYVG